MSGGPGHDMIVPAGLPLRKLDHNFNNAEGSILTFDQIQSLSMSNPLWQEFIGNRLGLEKRYGQLLHSYEESFAKYFGGYIPIDYASSGSKTTSPEVVVKMILTLAELSMSESSESSESPFTDEDSTLKRMGWEDVQVTKPRWALLSDTFAAATASSKTTSEKSSPTFFTSQKPYGDNPVLLHIEGVSDDELRDQIYEAKAKGCIGIIVEIVENQYNGRVMDPITLKRLDSMCTQEQLLLAVDETLTAIRCGAPFSFQREEYFDKASPDLVFFGKAVGTRGTAIGFKGQFVQKLGLFGSSRGRAIGKWQSQFLKPIALVDLIQSLSAIDMAVRGNLAMLSRVIGHTVRSFVLEKAEERGHEVEARDVLGGLESLIFVRKDIAGTMLVMGANTAGAWIPWVKWLPRLERDMSRSEILEEIIGSGSRSAREELSKMLLKQDL
ncbi:Putative pyridoxal phosphate-dependent transferase, major domain-containing protein [Colletotrichum destructivum]|uniref:Pyridoxal phosphate-dependent transferase, major domain-containing protein n=1 Tax=Colletotrichum destructivum TaxID=34406 RepID=A0AAX4IRE3_9PEZI|nr:Putative pyridoxal phosphate-dependent transferase, major domain-containing protein [Colletotrichum destructivum]